MLGKHLKNFGNQPVDHHVDHREVDGESKNTSNHNRCGCLNLFPGRPCNAAHFQFQLAVVFLNARWPCGNPTWGWCDIGHFGFHLVLQFLKVAGAEGLEPPKAVLETAGLPLAYAPSHDRTPSH